MWTHVQDRLSRFPLPPSGPCSRHIVRAQFQPETHLNNNTTIKTATFITNTIQSPKHSSVIISAPCQAQGARTTHAPDVCGGRHPVRLCGRKTCPCGGEALDTIYGHSQHKRHHKHDAHHVSGNLYYTNAIAYHSRFNINGAFVFKVL